MDTASSQDIQWILWKHKFLPLKLNMFKGCIFFIIIWLVMTNNGSDICFQWTLLERQIYCCFSFCYPGFLCLPSQIILDNKATTISESFPSLKVGTHKSWRTLPSLMWFPFVGIVFWPVHETSCVSISRYASPDLCQPWKNYQLQH